MKTLQIKNGDLVVGPSGFQTISGPAMIMQDLRMALGEPLGNDRFHPGYGSALDSMVGGLLDPLGTFKVKQEVNRVITNYAAVQQDKIQRDSLSALPSRFRTDDVLSDVSGIYVNAKETSVSIQVGLVTAAGNTAVVSSNVGN